MILHIKEIIVKLKQMQSNSKVIARNVLYAFIIKGLALGISFFSTPLFISYFHNNEILGVWYTMLSVLTWFLSFDFGVSNGLRNNLVKAISSKNDDNIRNVISSGVAAVGTVSLILYLIGLILINNVDLNRIYNIHGNIVDVKILRISTIMIFSSIMLRFFLNIVNTIFYALQKSAINNLIALGVSCLQLLYIIIFRFENSEQSLLNISYAYFIISNVPVIIAGFIVFSNKLKNYKPNYNYITIISIKRIIGIGMIFFLCQIFYLLIVNSNEFFITFFWSPIDTTDYTFYYKINLLLSIIVTLGLTPIWSMITKAYEEREYAWLVKLYKFLKITCLVLCSIQFLIVPFLQTIMNLWLGVGELNVQLNIAIAFACFGSSFLYSSMLSTIVCGLSKMRLQMYFYGIGAFLKIIFIIWISKHSSSWVCIVWCNVAILVSYSIIQQIKLNKLFNHLKIQ